MSLLDAVYLTPVIGIIGLFIYGMYVLEKDKSFNRKNKGREP